MKDKIISSKYFKPVTIIIAILLILCFASFISAKMNEKEKKFYDTMYDKHSYENINTELSEEMTAFYKYLLVGEHKAHSSNNPEKELSFTFNSDNSYIGYSTYGGDNFGTYKLSGNKDGVLLTITYDNGEDIYKIDVLDNEDIILTLDENTYYTLSNKE